MALEATKYFSVRSLVHSGIYPVAIATTHWQMLHFNLGFAVHVADLQRR